MNGAPQFLEFYDPEFYDLGIGPGRRVSDIYTKLAKEIDGPVLELGSGTGQVVLSIAAEGVPATGVEGAPKMLERAYQNLAKAPATVQRNANFIAGLIEEFEPRQEYAQVFFSNDLIAHIHNDEQLVKTLERYRKCIAPGGRLVLDIPLFDYAYMGHFAQPLHHVPRLRGESPWRSSERVLCWETTSVDPTTGLLIARFCYEILAFDQTLKTTINRELRLYPRRAQEVRLILSAAGFAHVSETRYADPTGTFLLFVAKRSG